MTRSGDLVYSMVAVVNNTTSNTYMKVSKSIGFKCSHKKEKGKKLIAIDDEESVS